MAGYEDGDCDSDVAPGLEEYEISETGDQQDGLRQCRADPAAHQQKGILREATEDFIPPSRLPSETGDQQDGLRQCRADPAAHQQKGILREATEDFIPPSRLPNFEPQKSSLGQSGQTELASQGMASKATTGRDLETEATDDFQARTRAGAGQNEDSERLEGLNTGSQRPQKQTTSQRPPRKSRTTTTAGRREATEPPAEHRAGHDKRPRKPPLGRSLTTRTAGRREATEPPAGRKVDECELKVSPPHDAQIHGTDDQQDQTLGPPLAAPTCAESETKFREGATSTDAGSKTKFLDERCLGCSRGTWPHDECRYCLAFCCVEDPGCSPCCDRDSESTHTCPERHSLLGELCLLIGMIHACRL